MGPGQASRGRTSAARPPSPSLALPVQDLQRRKTSAPNRCTPNRQEVLSEAELHFLACCFYNLPTLKIKPLRLPSLSVFGPRFSFLPNPRLPSTWAQEPVSPSGRVWVLGLGSVCCGPGLLPRPVTLYPEGPRKRRQTHCWPGPPRPLPPRPGTALALWGLLQL